MEKNIHDDRLDDYVRKSFEDYEEDPASDMWGRIEEVLPPVAPGPVIGPGKPSIRRYFWQMSAAAAILLLISSLVCGRMYYENKIRDISEQQNKPENSVAQPAVQAPYPAGSGLMAPDKMKTEQENAGFGKTESPSPSSAAVPVPSINSYVNTATEKPFTKPQAPQSGSGDTPVTSASVSTSALPSISSGNKSVPERNTLANAPLPQTPESLQPPATVAGNDITPVLADSAAASTADFVPINDFQLLETKKSSPLSHTFAGFKPLILPVQPLRQSSSWYVGVQVSPILMVEKKGTERPATLRPRLVSAQEKTSFTADYWLKAGKQLQGRWGFETGIGYREIEKNAAHRPRFRFMNGRPGGNAGNHARNYDFDYDLDT
ncbi:MAG: hypothetical protein IT262_16445, partial [Saprospiraceae bacterium]|nr:hypothetical protein [Saprospiraceae bacterium]